MCVLSEKISLDDIDAPIPIDTSVQDWIKEIEDEIKGNKKNHYAKEKINSSEGIGVINGKTELKFMNEIFKIKEFCEMKCSY